MFSTPDTPPVPLPPQDPERIDINADARRKASQSNTIKTNPIGVAAAPIMTPNIMLGN